MNCKGETAVMRIAWSRPAAPHHYLCKDAEIVSFTLWKVLPKNTEENPQAWQLGCYELAYYQPTEFLYLRGWKAKGELTCSVLLRAREHVKP
jgi:hypothetical protein